MRTKTIVGLLIGAGIAATAGVAIAARRISVTARPPFFAYRLQEGDTLSALALRFFGDASKWPTAFLTETPGLFYKIETLPVGSVVRVPCQWHTVRKGDTLAKIAGDVLGDGGRWRRIYAANRDTLPDPNRLEIGQILAVPALPGERGRPTTATSVGALDFLAA
jgi:nucleoid-associated protein YgaU